MSAKNIYLWVSCLALALLSASCSGSAGSPIQENLDASDQNEEYVSTLTDEERLNLPGMPGGMETDADKDASYIPGLPCMIGPGFTIHSPFEYGWRSGMVVDSGPPDQTWLLSNPGGPLAWNAYAFKEVDAGSLQLVTLRGYGKSLAVYMYDWNTPGWDFMGVHDLAVASPANLPVAPQHAPNGVTFMVLVQLAPAETILTSVETDVF